MLKDIVEKPVPMHKNFSSESIDFLKMLLERNSEKRLGSGPEGTKNLMNHPFFSKINWDDLNNKKIKPDVVPFVNGPSDCRNIDKMFTDERARETPADESVMTNTIKKQTTFDQWTFEN